MEAEDGESVLGVLLRNEVAVENGCRVGACQACLLRSSDPVPPKSQQGLDDSLVERGVFMSCQADPVGVTSVERVGSEVLPSYSAELVEKRFATEDVAILTLRCEGLPNRPGKFVRLSHASGITRAYSLATPAWGPPGLHEFHVRIIPEGQMSGLLLQAKAGERFQISGPLGKCAYRSEAGLEPMLLIGSGTGLAPLYGIASEAIQRGHQGQIHLYHGAATSSRLYFREEMSRLTEMAPNVYYVTCAEAEIGEGDRTGSPLTHALADLPNLEGFKVYLCGHPDLVKSAQKKCFLAGANLRDIAADAFVPT